MATRVHHVACNCMNCNPEKAASAAIAGYHVEVFGTHTTANQSKINLEPYRLEQLAFTAISSFFSVTHPKLLGNMTLDAIADTCFNLPEVVAYVAAAAEQDSSRVASTAVAKNPKVGWRFLANKYIRGRISYELRGFINSSK